MAKDEPISGVRPKQENQETHAQAPEHEIQDLVRQGETLTRQVGEEKKPLDAETLAKISRELPRLIQKTLLKLEAGAVYPTFKLVGRDYVVCDRRDVKETAKAEKREKTDEGKKIKEEAKKPIEEVLLARGKLNPAKEKEYENYLADPLNRMRPTEQKAAEERLFKLFTRFERMLLRRFEGGEEMAQPQEKGEKSFLKKTGEQWRDFFSKFVSRTVKRSVSLENVHECFFRGFVQKPSRATVISDVALNGGGVEKFVRWRLNQAEKHAPYFSKLEAGQRLSKEELRRFLAGDLEYLAIKQSESETAFAKAPLKGKFLETAQAEALVASDLGLQLGEQTKEKERILREMLGRKKGASWGGPGGGGIFGEKDSDGDSPKDQFIPWWQYGLKKPAIRWGLTAFLFIVLTGILIGLSALF